MVVTNINFKGQVILDEQLSSKYTTNLNISDFSLKDTPSVSLPLSQVCHTSTRYLFIPALLVMYSISHPFYNLYVVVQLDLSSRPRLTFVL